jgi:hypothetical protein
MNRRTRNVYNKALYMLLRGLFAWSPDIEFFRGANGDSLTFRYGNRIYKYWNIPFLFRPRSFKEVIALHQELLDRGLGEYVPRFITARSYIAYEYLSHTRDLACALIEEKDPSKRLDLFGRALEFVSMFHAAGILHGDLKPKNILVTPEGRLYLIDLEDAVVYDDPSELVDDYRKFIPRLIYLFTAEELRTIIVRTSLGESLRIYMEQSLVPFDTRELIQAVPDLTFEHAEDSPGEDVDVTVPDHRSVATIVKHIDAAGLDCRLFYRSQDDVKLYAYNLSGVAEIDIHLARPIGRTALRQAKTRSHAPMQIAVTGPDGVGKTTLLAAVSEHPHDALLARIPLRVIHAWRFAREGWTPPMGKWTFKERVAARWREHPLGLRFAYKRLLRKNVTPLILLDRSFYDPYLQGKPRVALWRAFFPHGIKVILLTTSPAAIAARKPQLSTTEIERYYRRAAKLLPIAATLDALGSIEEVQAHLERVVRFFFFTESRFLP